jgi:glycosyltransferase involved in cell wall biosynthesis
MAACTVFVCNGQRKYWQRRAVSSPRNEVIHNGVDVDHFSDRWGPVEKSRLRRGLGFADGDFVVGISAVLRPEKNHLQLVDAVARLQALGIPARALMIGDGDSRNAVEARARELEIENAIRITGFQKEVRPLIAVCDVMVLCSIAIETFSLAALESMALSKPVVHSNVGGAAEMIFPGENGYLFPAGDTKSVVARLASLADRGVSSCMGKKARTLVEKMFSEKRMIDRYEDLLLEICRTQRNPAAALEAPSR